MQNKSVHIAACIALAFAVGCLSAANADVAITAVPGMDYKGSTVTVSGTGESSGTLVIDTKEYQGSAVGGNVVFNLADLLADHVYDATITIGGQTYQKRLYQGDVAYTPQAWFQESVETSPKQGGWNAEPTVSSGRFVFVDEDDAQGQQIVSTFTPNGSQSDRLAIVEMDVTFEGTVPVEELPSASGLQAAVALVADGNYVKFAYLADGEWHVSDIEAEGDYTTVYTVRATLDRMNKNVRYEVKEGAGAAVEIFDGPSSSVGAGMTSVAFSGDGTLGTLSGNNSTDSAEAWICEADKKYKSIGAAITAGQTSMDLLWDASWTAPTEPNGYTFTGAKTLKILGGTISEAVSLAGVSAVFAGGRYTATSKGYGTKADDCRWVERVPTSASGDTYVWEVLAGTEQIAADEKVYVVSGGDIAFSATDLASKGYIDTTSGQSVSEQLNANGANTYPTWENAVLGLSNTDSAAKPVPQPVQSAEERLVLRLGNVAVDTKTNAKVTYRVYSDNVPVSDAAGYNEQVAVNLPGSGVKYYTIKVTAVGAN